MYDIEDMIKSTNLMLNQGMDVITGSMSDLINDQRSGMTDLHDTYEQLLKLKNIEESI